MPRCPSAGSGPGALLHTEPSPLWLAALHLARALRQACNARQLADRWVQWQQTCVFPVLVKILVRCPARLSCADQTAALLLQKAAQ